MRDDTKTAIAEKIIPDGTGRQPSLDKERRSKKNDGAGKECGFVTYDQLNAALPPDQVSSEQIEDTMSMLSEAGINVVENEDNDDSEEEKTEKEHESSRGNVDENEIGPRPSAHVLREMGSGTAVTRGRNRYCETYRGWSGDDDRGDRRQLYDHPCPSSMAMH